MRRLTERYAYEDKTISMNFEKWIVLNSRAGSASAIKYSGAISGRLSTMAIEHGLSKVGLFECSSAKVTATNLKSLDEFIELNSTGNSMYSRALDLFIKFIDSQRTTVEDDILEIIQNQNITSTEKENLVKSRIGQNKFRNELKRMWGCCAVTGCSEEPLLVASHIKPWSESTNEERLNKFNGLLLISTIDKAFDAGLITFDKIGRIIISETFVDCKAAGINEEMKIDIQEQHQKYMKYHRKYVFKYA